MLYLVSTPIGHLEDFSKRAINVLSDCDLILCEDTRHSKVLLDHYGIQKPLKSYHKFNENEELESILTLLKQGKNLALITDAGTPCIQDPGATLVKACKKGSIDVRAIAGPCAFVMAITLSGEEQGPFQFIGFLEKKEQSLKKQLLSALNYEGHTLAYVSPHQVIDVLEMLNDLDPHRPLFLVKELTKIYETHLEGTPSLIKQTLLNTSSKGEFVLMIKKKSQTHDFSELSLKDHVKQLEKAFDLSINEAIKLAAKQRGLSKRDVYQAIHHTPKD